MQDSAYRSDTEDQRRGKGLTYRQCTIASPCTVRDGTAVHPSTEHGGCSLNHVVRKQPDCRHNRNTTDENADHRIRRASGQTKQRGILTAAETGASSREGLNAGRS